MDAVCAIPDCVCPGKFYISAPMIPLRILVISLLALPAVGAEVRLPLEVASGFCYRDAKPEDVRKGVYVSHSGSATTADAYAKVEQELAKAHCEDGGPVRVSDHETSICRGKASGVYGPKGHFIVTLGCYRSLRCEAPPMDHYTFQVSSGKLGGATPNEVIFPPDCPGFKAAYQKARGTF